VHRLFGLLFDVAEELVPRLQIIVCDHANVRPDVIKSAIS
jgi:hypothetical protein